MDIGGVEYQWTRRKSSVKASPGTNLDAEEEQIENVFFADFSRTVGYKNCLEEAFDPKRPLKWCAMMEQGVF